MNERDWSGLLYITSLVLAVALLAVIWVGAR